MKSSLVRSILFSIALVCLLLPFAYAQDCSIHSLCYNAQGKTFCSPKDSTCQYRVYTGQAGNCNYVVEEDTDADGWTNTCDAFKEDATEWVDFDGDQVGHNADCNDVDPNVGVCDNSDSSNSNSNEDNTQSTSTSSTSGSSSSSNSGSSSQSSGSGSSSSGFSNSGKGNVGEIKIVEKVTSDESFEEDVSEEPVIKKEPAAPVDTKENVEEYFKEETVLEEAHSSNLPYFVGFIVLLLIILAFFRAVRAQE